MITLFDFCSVHPLLPWFLPFILGLGIGWLLWAKYKNEVKHLKRTLLDVNYNNDQLATEVEALKKGKDSCESQLRETRKKMRELESYSAVTITEKVNPIVTSQSISSNVVVEQNVDHSTKLTNDTIVSEPITPSVETPVVVNVDEEVTEALPMSNNADNFKRNDESLISNDNLQVLEGIGPKVQDILNEHGVKTFEDLSYKSTDQLRAILDTYGTKYRMIDPEPWVDQAKLAVVGDWDGVVEAQKYIYSRKNPESNQMPDTKLEKYLIKTGYLRKYSQDDLKAVEGIGPKIEELLHIAGIKTWANLSDTSVERLKVILEQAGPKFMLAEPTTWPEQALLAHKGAWSELWALQDELKGGRKK